jgi:hypothetical protein
MGDSNLGSIVVKIYGSGDLQIAWYGLRLLASASGSIMDFATANLASLLSSGPNGRIPSREWAMSEEERGGSANRRDEERK